MKRLSYIEGARCLKVKGQHTGTHQEIRLACSTQVFILLKQFLEIPHLKYNNVHLYLIKVLKLIFKKKTVIFNKSLGLSIIGFTLVHFTYIFNVEEVKSHPITGLDRR